MKTSQRGIDLIRQFEGERLSAYLCPAGIPTIGVGHTGPDVHMGMRITAAQSEALLKQDLAKFETGVEKLVTHPITQDQFDALVSFSFRAVFDRFESAWDSRRLRFLIQNPCW